MSIAVQFQTISFMAACGILMGMGFDTYQVFRGRGRFPRWLVFLLDVCFWLVSIGLVFFVLLRVNDGVVRFPIFIGLLVGAWFYFLLGSKKYIQFLIGVIKFCQWLYRTVLMIFDTLIVRPVVFLSKLIWMLVTFLFSVLMTVGSFIWRIILFITTPFAKLGRNVGKSLERTGTGFWSRIKKWITLKKKRD